MYALARKVRNYKGAAAALPSEFDRKLASVEGQQQPYHSNECRTETGGMISFVRRVKRDQERQRDRERPKQSEVETEKQERQERS